MLNLPLQATRLQLHDDGAGQVTILTEIIYLPSYHEFGSIDAL
jgi:hypothetical protein